MIQTKPNNLWIVHSLNSFYLFLIAIWRDTRNYIVAVGSSQESSKNILLITLFNACPNALKVNFWYSPWWISWLPQLKPHSAKKYSVLHSWHLIFPSIFTQSYPYLVQTWYQWRFFGLQSGTLLLNYSSVGYDPGHGKCKYTQPFAFKD